jgi:hypothetical protein
MNATSLRALRGSLTALVVLGATAGLSLVAGCSSSSAAPAEVDTGTPDTGTPDTSTPDTSTPDTGTPVDSGHDADAAPTIPPPPTLGAQIDRFGRPAVNTALNHSFDANAMTAGPAKDAYNASSTPSGWAASYAAEMAKNLAILDGLDTVCGNQLLAGSMLTPTRYSGLAGALADDRQYLKTDATACTQYLAVELNATGVAANGDCGGRKLDYDVIDTSYSAFAIGVISGVGDGVPPDADTKGTTFPYLAAPH